MSKKRDNRHLMISSKLIEMGNALMKEGYTTKDFSVTQTGTFLILIGGVLFSEEDVKLFAQLCSMFSSKKILDNLEEDNTVIGDYLRNKGVSESYESFIKRIKDLRDRIDSDDSDNSDDNDENDEK